MSALALAWALQGLIYFAPLLGLMAVALITLWAVGAWAGRGERQSALAPLVAFGIIAVATIIATLLLVLMQL
jgi:hypothetical protein